MLPRSAVIRAACFDANGVLYHRGSLSRASVVFSGLSREERQRFVPEWKVPDQPPTGTDVQRQWLRSEHSKASRGVIAERTYYTHLVRSWMGQWGPMLDRSNSTPKERQEEARFVSSVLVALAFFDRTSCRAYPRTKDGLLRLRQELGVKIGCITDTMASSKDKLDWLAQAGVELPFEWDGFIASTEVGVQKPDAKIYLEAARVLAVPPQETIFVGHSADELYGAQEVGMIPVRFFPPADPRPLVKRAKDAGERGFSKDWPTVTSLVELCDLLKQSR